MTRFQFAVGCVFALSCLSLKADPPYSSGPSIIDRLASSTAPLEERERLNYLAGVGEARHRNYLVRDWLKRSSTARSFWDFEKALQLDQPDLFVGLKKQNNLDIDEYELFYAESLLLFKMLRNNQNKTLLDDQFLRWRTAWLTVDMRLLRKELATQWSAVLLGTFTLAFTEAGPWSVESETHVDQYFSRRPEFAGRTRNQFLTPLLALSSYDPQRSNRETGLVLAGMVAPVVPAFTSLMIVMNYVGQYTYPSGFLANVGVILSGLAFAFTPSILGMHYAPKWPRAYEILGKRLSMMFPPGGPRCQDMLTNGRRDEK